MLSETNFSTYFNSYLNDDEIDNEVCLISGDKLEVDCVNLPCNHKFNYQHIYNEVINQKNNFNGNEIIHLSKNELKCPYCRAVHKCLLPYNSKYKYLKNIMIKKEKNGTCVAILKSGPNKGTVCNRKCENNLCYMHRNYIIT